MGSTRHPLLPFVLIPLPATLWLYAAWLWWFAPTILAQVPTVSVTGLTFTDLDLDSAGLGGKVQWTQPGSVSTVAGYTVGLATNSAGTGLYSLGTPAVGTNEASFGPDVAVGSYTDIVVYTRNADGRQATPVALTIVDASASATSVAFVDDDLDVAELGGDVAWTAPVSSDVVSYYAYLASNTYGASRSLIGSAVPFGTNTVRLAADAPLNLYGYVLVYTKSSLAQQSAPASVTFVDTEASVSNLVFVDKDLDAGQIGGDATWTEPADLTRVRGYQIFWAEDSAGSVKLLVNSYPSGTVSHSVAANTAKTTKAFVLVYTLSALATQSTPLAFPILDRHSFVTNLAFPDTDLDAQQLGGVITWTAPLDVAMVTYYSVCFAVSPAGAGKVQQGSDIAVATNLPMVAQDTALGSFTYILVYTKSALSEQTTPCALLIDDLYGGVSGITLADQDLDDGQLGGTITWTPPTDTVTIVEYNVYFAKSTSGAGKSQHGAAVPLHTNALALAADFEPGSFTHIVVYSNSSDAGQTTPSFVILSDTHASVSSVHFTDYDLDKGELWGEVTWSAPDDMGQVTLYHAFLADTGAGGNRKRLGGAFDFGSFGGPGTNFVAVPANTPLAGAFGDYKKILVYTSSELGEQTTAASFSISDAHQTVSGIAFSDLDLDAAQFGGVVTWTGPNATTQVTNYAVYLSANSIGPSSRSLLGSNVLGVEVGTNKVNVPIDTAKGSYSHLVVFSRSKLGLQTTPAALALADSAITVGSITFTDLDLDVGDLAGAVIWNSASDITHVTKYALYLANGIASGVSRSQLGSTVAVGTNAVTLFADTVVGAYTHLVVHSYSSLAESTTPSGTLAIPDTDGTVRALTFGDRDFDSLQIGGVVHWQTPQYTTQVFHYAVYLAEDAVGTGQAKVGDTVSLGTNYVMMPVSTVLGSFTHVVVYSKSSVAWQTTPAAAVFADTPHIAINTEWTIANGDSTEPQQDGKWDTPEDGLEWTIKELALYSDSDCTTAVLTGTVVSSGQSGKYSGAERAFDGSIDTEWHAQCAPCTAGEAWVGMTVASVVKCFKWLQPSVFAGSGVRSVVLRIGGMELAKAQGLRGGQWEGLRYVAGPSGGGGWTEILR